MILIDEGVLESFYEVGPEVFICFLGSVVCCFLEFQKLFSFPGIYMGAVHIAEHGDDSGEGFLHGVVGLVYCMP